MAHKRARGEEAEDDDGSGMNEVLAVIDMIDELRSDEDLGGFLRYHQILRDSVNELLTINARKELTDEQCALLHAYPWQEKLPSGKLSWVAYTVFDKAKALYGEHGNVWGFADTDDVHALSGKPRCPQCKCETCAEVFGSEMWKALEPHVAVTQNLCNFVVENRRGMRPDKGFALTLVAPIKDDASLVSWDVGVVLRPGQELQFMILKLLEEDRKGTFASETLKFLGPDRAKSRVSLAASLVEPEKANTVLGVLPQVSTPFDHLRGTIETYPFARTDSRIVICDTFAN